MIMCQYSLIIHARRPTVKHIHKADMVSSLKLFSWYHHIISYHTSCVVHRGLMITDRVMNDEWHNTIDCCVISGGYTGHCCTIAHYSTLIPHYCTLACTWFNPFINHNQTYANLCTWLMYHQLAYILYICTHSPVVIPTSFDILYLIASIPSLSPFSSLRIHICIYSCIHSSVRSINQSFIIHPDLSCIINHLIY